MITLSNLIPLYCPSCGTPTHIERVDNPMSGKFKAHQALSCTICCVMYQLCDNKDIIRAAKASGGDLMEYFIDEDDHQDLNKVN
jgi:hypothetical protein